MTESSLASLLLTNRLVELDAKPLNASEYWSLLARVPQPEALLDPAALDELCTEAEAERIRTLLEGAAAFAFARERLEEEGVRVISTFDDQFPSHLKQRLGGACPAFLTVAGPIGWLGQRGVGVIGSRDASPEALDVAARVAAIAHDRGVPIVSGLARGVDQASMKAAVDIGAAVVGVPAEGLRVAAKTPDVRNRVHAGELCIASPFGPSMRFTAGNAMGRNKLIYALSEVTLVVCADNGSGGTWEGAKEALRKNFGTVAVWTGEGAGAGNETLIKLGAAPVSDLDELFTVKRVPTESTAQARLF